MKPDTSRFLLLLRTRAVSFTLAGGLLLVGSALVGISAAAAVLVAILFSLVVATLGPVVERVALRCAGCRAPNRFESERVSVLPITTGVPILVFDSNDPVMLHAADRVVLSVALLDLLEDRALLGYLAQASYPGYRAAVVGEAIVWSCLFPLALGRLLTRAAAPFGTLLAVIVGCALVLPMLVCREGFVRWAGHIFTPLVVAWVIIMVAAGGYLGLAGAMLLSVLMSPVARWVLQWEWQRVEKAADRATIERGLGAHLLEAIETLAWVQPAPPNGFLGWLFHPSRRATVRAESIRQHLASTS